MRQCENFSIINSDRRYYFCYFFIIRLFGFDYLNSIKFNTFHRILITIAGTTNGITNQWRIQKTATTYMEFFFNYRIIAPFVRCPVLFILLSSYVFWGHEATPINPLPLFGKHRAGPSCDGRPHRNWLTTTMKRRDTCHSFREYSTVNINATAIRTQFFVRARYFLKYNISLTT